MSKRVVIDLSEEQICLLAIAVMEYCVEDACENVIEMADAVDFACHRAERLNG